MKKYIDFDEVILSTEDLLFFEYKNLKSQGVQVDKTKYIEEFDWKWLLSISPQIDDSLEVLKTFDDFSVLTKISSVENEGGAKIDFLRKNGINNEVILVPYEFKKTDLVDPCGNILIDDNVSNLDDWYEKGGIPIFFNKNNSDYDSWGNFNSKYTKIKSLKDLSKLKF